MATTITANGVPGGKTRDLLNWAIPAGIGPAYGPSATVEGASDVAWRGITDEQAAQVTAHLDAAGVQYDTAAA